MKKMFFFRSHSSNTMNNNQSSPQSTEKPVDRVDKCAKINKGSEDPASFSPPCLRRSLSFSSGSPQDSGNNLIKFERIGSPSSSSSQSKQSARLFSRPRALTPERQSKLKLISAPVVRSQQRTEKIEYICSREQSNISEVSSYSSSKFLDRFIDGEQQKVKCSARTSPCSRKQFHKSVSYDTERLNQISQSFREIKDPGPHSRKLASHVVEKLSQSMSKDFYGDDPITIEDVYVSNLSKFSRNFTNANFYGSGRRDSSVETERVMNTLVCSAHEDLALFRKHQDAEKRVDHLSAELDKIDFVQSNDLSVPALVQTIKKLKEEKLKIAHEVTAVMENRIAEKAFFREKIKRGTGELEAKCRRLENEKNELQRSLEKELDRRSIEWSMKLEKLQGEEHRLRDRVRELAEQNVELQREVSYNSETETSARDEITNLEEQVRDLSFKVQEANKENQFLQASLSEMQSKTRAVHEDGDCIRRNYNEKVSECKDLYQAISRLQRTCNDQNKTIDGLHELCDAMGQNSSKDHFDFALEKLHMEHMRLTRVEHTLRKELESFKTEIDSLRRENIDLLTRLKNSRNVNEPMTFKLDRELQNRVNSLEDKFLSLLKETNQVGRKLLGHFKSKCCPMKRDSDEQLMVECEVKLQGLERAVENFAASKETISNVLHKKSKLHEDCCEKIQIRSLSDEMHTRDQQKSEEITKSELKAEILLTTLLREKLYSKELEIEQILAEFAAAIRCNDILKSQMQNAEDDLSCINHKMKELELQSMKKDETINQLQHDLQERNKDLGILRGILPKISEERDQMWEQVKQMTEKQMLLNSEICSLRKKIEVLDEDILVKEGQITILKDSVTKHFDLFSGQDDSDAFRWAR